MATCNDIFDWRTQQRMPNVEHFCKGTTILNALRVKWFLTIPKFIKYLNIILNILFECTTCGLYCFISLACYKSLGMENGKIPASAITASSSALNLKPNLARLNSPSAWAVLPRESDNWLQVDLGRIMAVKMIASQGRPIASYSQWVTSYEISSRVDGFDWVTYMENNAVKVSIYITMKLSLL